MRLSRAARAGGFSLLEMVIALSILAMSLGALYQAAGGATRNIRADEKYAYGVELARSLLAEHTRVPPQGLDTSGETRGGFRWYATSQPTGPEAAPRSVLHEIEVGVGWYDGGRQRKVTLNSVVEVLEE